MKAWYESKILWASVITFLIGALGLVGEFLQKADFSPYAFTLLASGVLTFIFRVWFTDKAVG